MQYEILTKQRDAIALARDLRKAKLLPFDSETDCTTNSFDYLNERQVVWQFFYKGTAYLIDCRTIDVQVFKAVMEDLGIKKLIHNSAFDAAWTKREHNISIRNIGDTRLMENLVLGMNLPRKPLKGMTQADLEALKPKYSSSLNFALQRRGLPAKFEFIPHHWNDIYVSTAHVDHVHILEYDKKVHGVIKERHISDKLEKWIPAHIEYDVRDVQFLIELWDSQVEFLVANDMEQLIELENRVAEITYAMMCKGFRVDTKGWLKHDREMTKIYDGAMAILHQIAPDIKWTAPGQVSKFFGVNKIDEARALTFDQLNPKKTFVPTDKETAHKAWMEAGLYQKQINTYGKNWIMKHVHTDGRVHCSYTQIINTGRFSCDNPNMQQIPVMIKRNNKVIMKTRQREFLVPSIGNRFVVADFKSQELAILAIGSGEESWLKCLREGGDLHAMVAKMLFPGWEAMIEAEQKEARRQAKDVNFGVAYGLGAFGLDEKLKIGQEACQELLNKFMSTFPKIRNFLNQNAQFCVRTTKSYSFPPFNRLRTTYLESEDWRRKNIGKNNPIQATAADMAKLAMVYMDDEGLTDYLVHMNHDELIADVPDEFCEYVKEVMAECMTRAAEMILGEALTTPDIHIVDNWMEAKG